MKRGGSLGDCEAWSILKAFFSLELAILRAWGLWPCLQASCTGQGYPEIGGGGNKERHTFYKSKNTHKLGIQVTKTQRLSLTPGLAKDQTFSF